MILDRDGVLNEVVVDPEHGTIDSPLHPDQVKLIPGVPETLARIGKLGFDLAIASNQPSAAKGKTTRANLDAVHKLVVERCQSAGARILSSHLCFHRAEDGCACRKPKPGLLEEAFRAHSGSSREGSWMVGDGVTDVQAGLALGLKTAFFGPRKCDACRIFEDRGLKPDFRGKDLAEFADFLEGERK